MPKQKKTSAPDALTGSPVPHPLASGACFFYLSTEALKKHIPHLYIDPIINHFDNRHPGISNAWAAHLDLFCY